MTAKIVAQKTGRFLPTLTEIVAPGVVPPLAIQPVPSVDAAVNEELIREIMRRLNATLETRLREALGALVLEQVQWLGPRLRHEIETVVRQVAQDAAGNFVQPGARLKQ